MGSKVALNYYYPEGLAYSHFLPNMSPFFNPDIAIPHHDSSAYAVPGLGKYSLAIVPNFTVTCIPIWAAQWSTCKVLLPVTPGHTWTKFPAI